MNTQTAEKTVPVVEARCSALPRIFTCNASSNAPEIKIDHSTKPARMGSAVHELIADVVRYGLDKLPDIESYIHKYELEGEEKEFRILSYVAKKAWTELFEGRVTLLEVEGKMNTVMEGISLSGSGDFIATEKDTGYLVATDWKSGYVETDAYNQVMGYLWLAREKYGKHPGYKSVVVWLRSRTTDIVDVTDADLDAWGEKFKAAIEGDNYSPGEACTYCPLATECEARTATVQTSISDLMVQDAEDTISEETLISLYSKSLLVKKALKNFDAALRNHVIQNGEMQLPDGRFIYISEQEKKEVKLLEASEKLKEYFGKSDLESLVLHLCDTDVLKLGKTKLLDLLGSMAPRGKKGEFKKQVMEDFETVDAVATTIIKKIQVSKKGKQQIGN